MFIKMKIEDTRRKFNTRTLLVAELAAVFKKEKESIVDISSAIKTNKAEKGGFFIDVDSYVDVITDNYIFRNCYMFDGSMPKLFIKFSDDIAHLP